MTSDYTPTRFKLWDRTKLPELLEYIDGQPKSLIIARTDPEARPSLRPDLVKSKLPYTGERGRRRIVCNPRIRWNGALYGN